MNEIRHFKVSQEVLKFNEIKSVEEQFVKKPERNSKNNL